MQIQSSNLPMEVKLVYTPPGLEEAKRVRRFPISWISSSSTPPTTSGTTSSAFSFSSLVTTFKRSFFASDNSSSSFENRFTFSYQDNEGDFVELSSDEELTLSVLAGAAVPLLIIHVTEKKGVASTSTTPSSDTPKKSVEEMHPLAAALGGLAREFSDSVFSNHQPSSSSSSSPTVPAASVPPTVPTADALAAALGGLAREFSDSVFSNHQPSSSSSSPPTVPAASVPPTAPTTAAASSSNNRKQQTAKITMTKDDERIAQKEQAGEVDDFVSDLFSKFGSAFIGNNKANASTAATAASLSPAAASGHFVTQQFPSSSTSRRCNNNNGERNVNLHCRRLPAVHHHQQSSPSLSSLPFMRINQPNSSSSPPLFQAPPPSSHCRGLPRAGIHHPHAQPSSNSSCCGAFSCCGNILKFIGLLSLFYFFGKTIFSILFSIAAASLAVGCTCWIWSSVSSAYKNSQRRGRDQFSYCCRGGGGRLSNKSSPLAVIHFDDNGNQINRHAFDRYFGIPDHLRNDFNNNNNNNFMSQMIMNRPSFFDNENQINRHLDKFFLRPAAAARNASSCSSNKSMNNNLRCCLGRTSGGYCVGREEEDHHHHQQQQQHPLGHQNNLLLDMIMPNHRHLSSAPSTNQHRRHPPRSCGRGGGGPRGHNCFSSSSQTTGKQRSVPPSCHQASAGMDMSMNMNNTKGNNNLANILEELISSFFNEASSSPATAAADCSSQARANGSNNGQEAAASCFGQESIQASNFSAEATKSNDDTMEALMAEAIKRSLSDQEGEVDNNNNSNNSNVLTTTTAAKKDEKTTTLPSASASASSTSSTAPIYDIERDMAEAIRRSMQDQDGINNGNVVLPPAVVVPAPSTTIEIAEDSVEVSSTTTTTTTTNNVTVASDAKKELPASAATTTTTTPRPSALPSSVSPEGVASSDNKILIHVRDLTGLGNTSKEDGSSNSNSSTLPLPDVQFRINRGTTVMQKVFDNYSAKLSLAGFDGMIVDDDQLKFTTPLAPGCLLAPTDYINPRMTANELNLVDGDVIDCILSSPAALNEDEEPDALSTTTAVGYNLKDGDEKKTKNVDEEQQATTTTTTTTDNDIIVEGEDLEESSKNELATESEDEWNTVENDEVLAQAASLTNIGNLLFEQQFGGMAETPPDVVVDTTITTTAAALADNDGEQYEDNLTQAQVQRWQKEIVKLGELGLINKYGREACVNALERITAANFGSDEVADEEEVLQKCIGLLFKSNEEFE